MRTMFALTVALLATALLAGPALGQDQSTNVTHDQIDAAIEKAIEWLWSEQNAQGLWPHRTAPDKDGNMRSTTGSRWPPGEHAMAMTALEYAQTPLDDERFRKGLKVLLELDLKKNYIISCRVVTLAHMFQRARDDRGLQAGLRQAMAKDCARLVANQGAIGGWRYGGPPHPPRAIDFSNTQLCILALSEAAKCGVEIPQEAMFRAHKRFIEDQKEDGGWNYGNYANEKARDEHSYGNMTAACVASLYLTNEFLTGGFGCPCRGGRSTRGKDITGTAIEDGLAWLNKHFSPTTSPKGYHYWYWIYQAERVGIATGLRYFGDHDWYQEICNNIVPKQNADGSFGNTVDTSFALIFLVKGRAPLLYSKLQHPGPWNLHSFDMKNLATHIGLAKEQRIGWQVLQWTTPSEHWFDAPVVFMTTEEGFELTDEFKQKLRAYTDGGGTLLLEASCGNGQARSFLMNMARDIWPEWELKRIDRDHPLWSADVQMRGRRPVLMEMHDGIRSIVFFSPNDLSCDWHLAAGARSQGTFDLGTNLPAYASDKAPLRRRLSGSIVRPGTGLPGESLAAPEGTALAIGRLAHGGDWYVGRHYGGLEQLAALLKEQAGLEATVIGELKSDDASAMEQAKLLWLAGRQSVSLNEAQQAAVKQRLAAGAFLVIENVMGDERLAESVQSLAGDLGLKQAPLPQGHDLVAGTLPEGFAGFDLSEGVEFSRSLKVERIGRSFAALVGLYDGDKLVGVYSPYDILYSLTGAPAFGRKGYESDHAAALAMNLALWAAAQGK